MARILTVKVQARSKAPGVEEVVERLAAHLGVPASRLTLLRGAASSRKLVRLEP